ncbi:adenine phosphoribosyltransferase [Candidatus Fermentibacteria bacterium]|nr:adenine phosphoribosyltransferase [Candidatus Fermentibacteria bacterium]
MLEVGELSELIRDVPDFPQKGVVFKDITTMLVHPGALGDSLTHLQRRLSDVDYDSVVCIESRGFLFGAVLAARENLPLILVRKPGKLPADTISQDYELEYGSNTIEMHSGSLSNSGNALIVDDLVATGGSVLATANLVEREECGVAAVAYVINLEFLGGREKIERAGYRTEFLIDVEAS